MSLQEAGLGEPQRRSPPGAPGQDITSSTLPWKCPRTGVQQRVSRTPGEGRPLPTRAQCPLNRRTTGSRTESALQAPLREGPCRPHSLRAWPWSSTVPDQGHWGSLSDNDTRFRRTGGSAAGTPGRAIPGGGPACQERKLQGRSHPALSGASPWTDKGSSA